MEPVRENELKAFFTYVIEALERLGVPYMVAGGFAAIFYGEPRLTIDVDIVADMEPEHVPPFVAAFPLEDYYVSEEAVYDSLQRRYPFNVIQPSTGAKVDIVPLPLDALTQNAFQRRQRNVYDEAGRTATFISPEDLILAKLVAFRQTDSDKHLRDARGVLVTLWGRLDLEHIQAGAQSLALSEQFAELWEAARSEVEGEE